MLKDRRGQIRVFEALLATAIVFAALLLAGPAYIALENNNDSETLCSTGLNVLIELDRDGELGRLVAQGNWTAISRWLSTLLPLGVSYDLTVYDEDIEIVNSSPIASGSLAGENIVSVQYILAERANFSFYVIRLQLAWMK